MSTFLNNLSTYKSSTKVLDFKDYLAIPYYSASRIKQYEQNPYMYKKCNSLKQVHIADEDFTKAKTFGSLLHKSILETKDFKDNEEYYMKMLQPADRKRFEKSRASLLKNATFNKILSKHLYYEKVFTTKMKIAHKDKKVEVYCKILADLITKNGWIVDLKTISSLEHVKSHVNKYRYDIQASFYSDVLKISGLDVGKGFIFVFVETKAPYECVIFYANDALLERGRNGGEWCRGYKQIIGEMHFEPKSSNFKDFQELPF